MKFNRESFVGAVKDMLLAFFVGNQPDTKLSDEQDSLGAEAYVGRVLNAVNSALGELKPDESDKANGKVKMSAAKIGKNDRFTQSGTEKHVHYSETTTTPLRFHAWAQRVEAAEDIMSFQAVIPCPKGFNEWLAKMIK